MPPDRAFNRTRRYGASTRPALSRLAGSCSLGVCFLNTATTRNVESRLRASASLVRVAR